MSDGPEGMDGPFASRGSGVPGPWAQAARATTALTKTDPSLGKFKRCMGLTLSDLVLRDAAAAMAGSEPPTWAEHNAVHTGHPIRSFLRADGWLHQEHQPKIPSTPQRATVD